MAVEKKDVVVDAVEQSKKEKMKCWITILSCFIKLLLTIGIIYLLFTQFLGITRMKGEMMYPSIRDGDVMIYYRLEKEYQLKDVVVFKRNLVTYTARIVAREGDTVDISEDGQFIVNGNAQNDGVFFETQKSIGGIQFPYKVKSNSYFLLYDNRTNTGDSRYFGAIHQNDIEGKVTSLLRRRGI